MKILSEITAVCISVGKGTRKENVGHAQLRPRHGLEGDAHAGDWHRQVSLLAEESIMKARSKGLDVKPGDFGENLTTRGIDLVSLPIGTRLAVGDRAVLEVTQIGKECHTRCAIYYLAGDCIMPREGIFARVICQGQVHTGDKIRIDNSNRVAVLTVSDRISRGEREDTTGTVIKEISCSLGQVIEYAIVPDEREAISDSLKRICDQLGADLILTSGGTGLGIRDITPEATLDVMDRQVPGLAEAMRQEGLKATPRAALSRGIAGIRNRTLIVNLPGSPKGARENLQAILAAIPHALEVLRGIALDCAEPHSLPDESGERKHTEGTQEER